jgi:N-acetylglucosaminyldiphosphoundecaprenol N-acetyl-beta-D-mannosaminyltransferase
MNDPVIPVYDLCGVPVHAVDSSDVLGFIHRTVQSRVKAVILHANIHGVNLAWRLPWMLDFYRSADLVFCDGDGVRWGLRFLGFPPPPKITYAAWIHELAEHCGRHGHRVYFIGGRPGVAAEAAQRLKERHPAFDAAGTDDGYFAKTGPQNDTRIERINRVRPDILVVGFGMPAQEAWLRDNLHRLDVGVVLTAGAAFDYASGRLRRAPGWMVRIQAEWLFRLIQEPLRLFGRYVLGNPSFFLHLMWCRLHGRTSRPRPEGRSS